MHSELTAQLEALIKQLTEELSTELVDWNLKKRGKTVVINIIADKFNGGITIDECTSINKRVVGGIEEKQWFGDNFVVEVSSPGLDRTLKTFNDFTRAIGRKVRVHLEAPVEGKVEHHGKISGVHDNQILIKNNDKTITIPLACITKAVQMISEA
ncbi:hypothetical protein IID10_14770 [candidate division KSB1 bacterium]|nr:hypothetical protein [candidate division KSB1 bacterium]